MLSIYLEEQYHLIENDADCIFSALEARYKQYLSIYYTHTLFSNILYDTYNETYIFLKLKKKL